VSDKAGIWSAIVPWDDPKAMATLLDRLPKNIATNIKKGPKAAQFFSHDGDAAYWVSADPIQVQIWTFRPCSEVEAAIMWALLRTDSDLLLDASTAIKLYRDATGRETKYVQ
jgi:hypothetical protein